MNTQEMVLADPSDFFAPVLTGGFVDVLVGEYRAMRHRVEQVAEMIQGETAGAVGYFLKGNEDMDTGRRMPAVEELFRLDGALAALNASYWQRAMLATGVLDVMPQDRRDEWNESIRKRATPEFEQETVRATLQDLLMSRSRFFAERVDGIFRALSGKHVTNSPMGFGKRMILTNITDTFFYATCRVGYINDLRCVIARFMGRDEPAWNATNSAAKYARQNRRGEWVTLDGGALRLRCYANGNAHLEVHPDMAWRLNCVLHQLHPTAIPSEFRQRPKAKPKDFVMMSRPLPFQVLSVLAAVSVEPTVTLRGKWEKPIEGVTQNPHARRFGYTGQNDKAVIAEAERVMTYIGGVKMSSGGKTWFEFEFCPDEAIAEVVHSGCIPDQRSHQYYPTPEGLASKAVDLAEIQPGDLCLEPSAGTGGLADLMRWTGPAPVWPQCVEISKVHCKVLESKGYSVEQADFLAWNPPAGTQYRRIVMNPPFSEGRWLAHLERAAEMLSYGGRLVAILPASAQKKDVLPGWRCTWHGPYSNEFAGTSISVVILVAERPSMNTAEPNPQAGDQHRPPTICPQPLPIGTRRVSSVPLKPDFG